MTPTPRNLRRFFKRECLRMFKKFAKVDQGIEKSKDKGALLIAYYHPVIPKDEGHVLIKTSGGNPDIEKELAKRLLHILNDVKTEREPSPPKTEEERLEQLEELNLCPECEGFLKEDNDRKLIYCSACDYSRSMIKPWGAK